MVDYECPECGATGKDNFDVRQSSFSHQQRSIGKPRRDEDTDNYICQECGESSKGFDVKSP